MIARIRCFPSVNCTPLPQFKNINCPQLTVSSYLRRAFLVNVSFHFSTINTSRNRQGGALLNPHHLSHRMDSTLGPMVPDHVEAKLWSDAMEAFEMAACTNYTNPARQAQMFEEVAKVVVSNMESPPIF
jgi:hypothetical protein